MLLFKPWSGICFVPVTCVRHGFRIGGSAGTASQITLPVVQDIIVRSINFLTGESDFAIMRESGMCLKRCWRCTSMDGCRGMQQIAFVKARASVMATMELTQRFRVF